MPRNIISNTDKWLLLLLKVTGNFLQLLLLRVRYVRLYGLYFTESYSEGCHNALFVELQAFINIDTLEIEFHIALGWVNAGGRVRGSAFPFKLLLPRFPQM